mgnify:CR=1 FL=1
MCMMARARSAATGRSLSRCGPTAANYLIASAPSCERPILLCADLSPRIILTSSRTSSPALPPHHPTTTANHPTTPTASTQTLVLGPGDHLVAAGGGGAAGLKFLLVAGKPIGEPIVQHGPFVMNTEEEIYQVRLGGREGGGAVRAGGWGGRGRVGEGVWVGEWNVGRSGGGAKGP